MFGYKFKCDCCEQDIAQVGEPELVIVPVKGESLSLQCCNSCAKTLRQEMADEIAKPEKPDPLELCKMKPATPLTPEEQREEQLNDLSDAIKRIDGMSNKVDQLTAAMFELIKVLQPK